MGCFNSTSGKAAELRAESRVGLKRAHVSFMDRVHEEWEASDKDGDQKLDKKEVSNLLHRLNLEIAPKVLADTFKQFDIDGNGTLDFEEFTKLFEAIQSLPELSIVFKAACINDKSGMVAEELKRFLTSSGKLNLTIFDCVKLIYKAEFSSETFIKAIVEEDDEMYGERPVLSYGGFQRLLVDGNVNSVFDENCLHQVTDVMTLPLSNYYISSSHNSYLSGNQLSSESSPAVISRALKLGVRVIELDAWDGSDGNPIVNHGHTMCKPVALLDCLEAINVNAFLASENHCSLPQQAVQAEMLSSVFGSKLYSWEGTKSDDGKIYWTQGPVEWESPESLKNRIVIRDKPIKKKKSEKEKKNSSPATQSATESEIDVSLSHEAEDEEDEEAMLAIGCNDKLLRMMYIKNVHIAASIDKEQKVVVYKEPGFRSSSSIVEAKMMKLTKPGYHARDISVYAQRHLVRVYPAGSRVDSSNYDPIPAWLAGLQVVALNYQTFSLPVWLNQGKFSVNGGSGYVLKPEFLRLPSQGWDGVPREPVLKYKVTVMSGHYLPKPLGKSDKSEVIDPYVTVSIHGVEADSTKFETKPVDNNGFNPQWNESTTFTIREPDVALISFVVHDYDLVGKDDFIAQNVGPVSSLVTGYKMVPLKFGNGAPCFAFLFVNVQIIQD